jgi:hypothetical protein
VNELKIEKFGDGRCAECGKEKPGVRIGLPFVGDTAFLCWEHYRLLQESLKPQRVVHEVVLVVEGHSYCCHPCCCHRSRTCTRSTYGVGRGDTRSEGISHSHSVGISEGRTRTDSWPESEGRSSGGTKSSSNGGPLP